MKLPPSLLRFAHYGLLVALFFSGIARTAAAGESDGEIIARMQRELAAIKAKLATTEDLKERERLSAEMVAVLEKTEKQVSPKLRPMLSVGLKLVQPLQTDAAAYTAAAGAFFEGENGDFRTIKSRADIVSRTKEIDRLESVNQQLLARINSLEGDAEALLKKAGISDAETASFMTGFRSSTMKQMGAMRAIRNLETKMYVQWKSALAVFDQEWGKWHSKGDAPVSWDSPEAEKKFSAIVAEIQRLAERQAAAQEQLLSR